MLKININQMSPNQLFRFLNWTKVKTNHNQYNVLNESGIIVWSGSLPGDAGTLYAVIEKAL